MVVVVEEEEERGWGAVLSSTENQAAVTHVSVAAVASDDACVCAASLTLSAGAVETLDDAAALRAGGAGCS